MVNTNVIYYFYSSSDLPTDFTVGVKKKETFCYYTTKILQYFVHKLQCVLRETTNRTTENYRSYYTKLQIVLHKTTDCTTQNYKSCYKYLDRLYYIKYTYLHTYMQTTKAIGDRACKNQSCEHKKSLIFSVFAVS